MFGPVEIVCFAAMQAGQDQHEAHGPHPAASLKEEDFAHLAKAQGFRVFGKSSSLGNPRHIQVAGFAYENVKNTAWNQQATLG